MSYSPLARISGLALAVGLSLGMAPSMASALAVARPAAAAMKAQPFHFRPLKKHPVVALTFDDLPAAGGLRKGESRVAILTALSTELRSAHMKHVYGFVNAVDLPGDSDCQHALELWLKAGMRIGNHTWSHPALDDVTAEAYTHNIALNEPYLRQYAGKTNWHWFRYPYLEEGDTAQKHEAVRHWLRANHYRVAEVTLNFNDDDWGDAYLRCKQQNNSLGLTWLEDSYLQQAGEFIPIERQREQVAFGHEIPNVLLLHGTEFTTLMLPRLIALLRSEGFRFSTVPKVERNHAYKIDPGVGLPGGGTLTTQVLLMRHINVPYPANLSEPVKTLTTICGGNGTDL